MAVVVNENPAGQERTVNYSFDSGWSPFLLSSSEGPPLTPLFAGMTTCAWLSAARRAAFSIRSWSTSARHSSHRLLASSADASAASSSCERDSRAFTCL